MTDILARLPYSIQEEYKLAVTKTGETDRLVTAKERIHIWLNLMNPVAFEITYAEDYKNLT